MPFTPDDDRAVRNLLGRFGALIDARDWDAYEGLFADAVAFDYAAAGFLAESLAPGAIRADASRVMGALDATQHLMGSVVIEPEPGGDAAEVAAQSRAMHLYADASGGDWYEQGGRYDGTVRRAGGRWVIARWRFRPLWARGNARLIAQATGG